MKIKVDRKKLLEKFQLAGSVVSASIVNPLYRNVKLEASEGKIVISATDLDVGIRTTLTEGVTVEEPGAVLLSEQSISGVLRTTPDAEVEITADDDAAQVITSDSNFRFPVEDLSDFASVADAKEEKGTVEIDPVVLEQSIKRTVFSIAEERDRYTLNGVYMKIKGEDVHVVGADGNRMALVRKKVVNTENIETIAIMPRKGAEQIVKLASVSKSPIKVHIDEHQITVWTDETLLSSVLLDGQYPDYEKIMSNEAQFRVELDRARFHSVVQRASLVVTSESLSVCFIFKPGSLVVESESAERGAATLNMPIDYPGEEFSIMFNPEYIEQFLRVVDSETVTFEFYGGRRAAMVRAGRDYMYFIMPISVESPETAG